MKRNPADYPDDPPTSSSRPSVTSYLLTALKIVVPVAILGWLLWKEGDAIQDLVTRPKNVPLLLLSLVCLLTATCLSFVRWYFLVRALEIPFTIREAIRLGFLGCLFNFVSPGAVGGDLFKGYFLAREQKQRKAEAVATILVDRVVGMFSLFCVGTFAILAMGAGELSELRDFLQVVVWLTFIGAVGVIVVLLPSVFTDWLFIPLSKLPIVGGIVTRILGALELYRKRRISLLLIGLLSIGIHIIVALTVHVADRALHLPTPALTEHLIISPLASVAAAAPVPGGLGTYELAMDQLFDKLPAQKMERGQGLRVAVIYRLLTIVIAGVGAVYYMLNRAAVAKAVSVIESEQHESGGSADGQSR